MSEAEKRSEVENCEFKWGKKIVIGGQQKEADFYESFSYDGTEYCLYDDVYLYTETDETPSIGKLLKIWEVPDTKLKRVEVLWFFQQDEILNWHNAGTSKTNEIFLGSGNGKGLANINDLEAIAGKCNVVCTSKDSRNPQPSPEELQRADYIFHRTFYVDTCTISDKFPDRIAATDVRFLLNKERKQQFVGGSEFGADNNEERGIVMASKEVLPLRPKASGKAGSPCDEKTKSTPPSDPLRTGKGLLKTVRFDEKALAAHASELIPKVQELEVAKKPKIDRSAWFRPLPWEERLQEEYERGNLVLFDNLDPEFSSKDVEDIVWNAFGEKCTAKVIPHTRICSPHSGQAFVIFEKRGAAEIAVLKLDESCLMLPNRRPLVARWPNASILPSSKKPPSTFFGHLAIDQIKRRTAEQKEAVSTSHCSQPNTIEFDMAMEWCLQHERSESTWEELYKRQKKDLQFYKARFSSI
ncbi:hypothetical protein ACHQM5_020389 [Ranunculus cassubicifolius]